MNLDISQHVTTTSKYYREPEKKPLVGDATKIKEKLNWRPSKEFSEIIYEMIDHDLELIKNENI